jgi:hypothetical protein
VWIAEGCGCIFGPAAFVFDAGLGAFGSLATEWRVRAGGSGGVWVEKCSDRGGENEGWHGILRIVRHMD